MNFYIIFSLLTLALLIVVVSYAIIHILNKKEKEYITEYILDYTLENIDKMDGSTFEQYLYYLFSYLEYETENVRDTQDFGVDLIVIKQEKITAVQAKRYSSNVGVDAVYAIHAGKSFYDCHAAMVVTNSYFTKSAKELATKIGVELWDRDKLTEILSGIAKKETEKIGKEKFQQSFGEGYEEWKTKKK